MEPKWESVSCPSTIHGNRNQMDGKLKNPVHPVTSIGTGIQRKMWFPVHTTSISHTSAVSSSSSSSSSTGGCCWFTLVLIDHLVIVCGFFDQLVIVCGFFDQLVIVCDFFLSLCIMKYIQIMYGICCPQLQTDHFHPIIQLYMHICIYTNTILYGSNTHEDGWMDGWQAH